VIRPPAKLPPQIQGQPAKANSGIWKTLKVLWTQVVTAVNNVYPPGGATGQALVKASAYDNDVTWGLVPTPGPYANDAAAAAAGVALLSQYYQPSGAVVVRLV
jgi:hypothetical protein